MRGRTTVETRRITAVIIFLSVSELAEGDDLKNTDHKSYCSTTEYNSSVSYNTRNFVNVTGGFYKHLAVKSEKRRENHYHMVPSRRDLFFSYSS